MREECLICKAPLTYLERDEMMECAICTMGCNVQCPSLPCSHREDWGLDDPTGKSDEAFLETIRLIEGKILDLKARLS